MTIAQTTALFLMVSIFDLKYQIREAKLCADSANPNQETNETHYSFKNPSWLEPLEYKRRLTIGHNSGQRSTCLPGCCRSGKPNNKPR